MWRPLNGVPLIGAAHDRGSPAAAALSLSVAVAITPRGWRVATFYELPANLLSGR